MKFWRRLISINRCTYSGCGKWNTDPYQHMHVAEALADGIAIAQSRGGIVLIPVDENDDEW